MNEKNYFVILGLIAVILITGVIFLRPMSVKIANLQELTEKLGAVSGPSVSGPSFSINGVEKTAFSSGFYNASSTLCSFRNTTGATTTLLFASLQIDTATDTALIYEVGKSTVMDATTTKIGSTITIGSSVKDTIVASSTLGVNTNLVLSPLDYLVWKKGGGFGKTDAHLIKGTCKAEFVIN